MHMMMNTDADKVAGAKLNRRTARRVLGFARPYRGAIITFVVVIVLESVLALVPIYVLKRIIDVAIPEGNRGLLHALAGLALVAALFIAGLSFVERFYSSRIGEGLIYDLRVKLFDHVSAMPIGFFTRTQTGALMSRMNNDVIGAQRAVTDHARLGRLERHRAGHDAHLHDPARVADHDPGADPAADLRDPGQAGRAAASRRSPARASTSTRP